MALNALDGAGQRQAATGMGPCPRKTTLLQGIGSTSIVHAETFEVPSQALASL